MNGRSGGNNVEIKSGQQVCVVFFFLSFSFFSYRWSCILQWQKKSEKRRGVCEGNLDRERERRWEEEGGKGGGHDVSHVIIFLKDKSKKLHANIRSIYLPAKCLPFSFDDEISQCSKVTEIQLEKRCQNGRDQGLCSHLLWLCLFIFTLKLWLRIYWPYTFVPYESLTPWVEYHQSICFTFTDVRSKSWHTSGGTH